MPVRALIGAPSAGGALGHRLARLCLETVLYQAIEQVYLIKLLLSVYVLTIPLIKPDLTF